MLDAYHLNTEETEIREARQLNPPIVIQRLFILQETIEEEYLDSKKDVTKDTEMEQEVTVDDYF